MTDPFLNDARTERQKKDAKIVEGDYMELNGGRKPSNGGVVGRYDSEDEERGGRKRRARQPSASSKSIQVTYKEGSLNGSSWRNELDKVSDLERRRKNVVDDEQRRSRRVRRTDVGTEPRPVKRVYNARNLYSGSLEKAVSDRGDPPLPNSKVWLDYETFKKFLRWEAQFRMYFVPESFYDDIKRESDWRLGLYKGWLWRLHDGFGEGIVPRSRYERARRMRLKRGIVDPDDVAGDQRIDARTSKRRSKPSKTTSRGPRRD
jgi:hypothetical protein